MVVAQLAELSLPTPEIRDSNADISNEIFQMCLSIHYFPENTKIKKKRPRTAHLKKTNRTLKTRQGRHKKD